ncbi:hypothetical protein QTJ16_006042 [Diplocarpon rosae]|uniref:Uncharacterized protein n=1 Tax=Diplocarpon rosae TaxID=946125 RepID=A0AAD9SXR5_9HELO|nr:hypothetical protein QTJ16_006042 [Diplocarpon rosae]PBP23454.1 hypothetical protein BUE80_DR005615 [Diplocarpon rosae]
MPANVKSLSGRFEIPQITPINYSLTDGTGIPPPPDSPVEERLHVPAAAPASAMGDISCAARHSQSATVTDGYESREHTSFVDTPPMSPSSTRQGSVRRFLSRKSLNTNYTDGTTSHEDLARIDRPESAMSFASQRPSLAKKKSRNWFKRLGSSNSSKRTSVIYEDRKQQPLPQQAAPVPVKKGPPPPKLPELKQFAKGEGGSLGAEDMFKNIK